MSVIYIVSFKVDQEGLEIGTSFSKRRSLNIFWTQRCFWHLSAPRRSLQREEQAGSRQTLPGTCFPASVWLLSGPVGPCIILSTMSSRNILIASLLISGQTLAAPPFKGSLKLHYFRFCIQNFPSQAS